MVNYNEVYAKGLLIQLNEDLNKFSKKIEDTPDLHEAANIYHQIGDKVKEYAELFDKIEKGINEQANDS